MPPETDLYAPVKSFLEGQGYTVKGEVHSCDVVAVRAGEPPVVVELKRMFGLGLVLQGIDRLSLTDAVYLAVGCWPPRCAAVKKLCRRLGLGLMIVDRSRVDVLLDPLPYRPRKNTRRAGRLLGEHARRVGDPNLGGSTRQPIMTAYRQEALRCAQMLAEQGPMALATMRAAGDVPNAGRILRQDVYGWFERVGRGTYTLSPGGVRGLERFAGEIGGQRIPPDGAARAVDPMCRNRTEG
jgi:hypothetical protein